MVESTLKTGKATLLHRHNKSEEVCYIISGNGRMTLGDAPDQGRRHDSDPTRYRSQGRGDRELSPEDARFELSCLFR